MAKKQQRSEADRRLRQCERLGRLLRLLHLIMGKGRWDATTLAEELDCSRRTVFRLLQTLSLAGVPWYFDESVKCYRVRPGFKFSIPELDSQSNATPEQLPEGLKDKAEKLISDGEKLINSLQQFLNALRQE